MAERIIVFDLDETLGHFGSVSTEWLSAVVRKEEFAAFCAFMDDRQHCYCAPMIRMLASLLKARDSGNISRIVIYTNNNGHPSWANAIAGHIGYLLNTRVFDAVVGGYRPSLGGNQCRSGHEKTYEDLCRCLQVPHGTEVCFIDDQDHPSMRSPFVTYVEATPYYGVGGEAQNFPEVRSAVQRFCKSGRCKGKQTRRRITRASGTRRVGRTIRVENSR